MGLIIFGALLLLVGILFLTKININDDTVDILSILGGFLCMIGGAIIMAGVYEKDIKGIPTAMDVYQGKTTLQITYKDSIPVDSVVVFKDKKE